MGELCNESDWSEPATVKPFPPPQVIQSSNYLQYIIYALLLAIGILALAYMFAKIFGIPHWIEIIKDELFQVILTGIVALLLVGITQLVNYYLGSALAALPDYTTTIPDNTNQIFKAAYQELGSLSSPSLLSQIQKENKKIAKEASKGIYCNMLGVGFSLVNCSPLNAFRGTLTSASFTVLAGMIDIYAQQILLSFGANFGFNLLIPLGLFFRCFKPTRQAGGALIAIGFGFYTVYPLVIVATLKTLALSETLQVPQPQTIPTISECDPYEIDVSKSRQQFQIYAAELSRPTISDYLTYEVLVKTIFLSILNLIITLGFISSFAKILGTEIDLAGLARIG
ncbi:MAG: hypothetical protein N3G80_02755 [Candidatus Micrarchaeota archaeon]|nr:hypothetical protein [Candidatus Micrarchaeota archaeon]